MLTRSRRLTIGLAAGALTMVGAAGAIAAVEGPVGGQPTAVSQRADDGGGPNPLCMVRPQDCMQPPGNGSGGGSGNGQGSGGGSGSG
jgi:hypothetical protein